MLLRKNTIEDGVANEKKYHNLIQLYHIGKINTNDCCAIFQLILFL